jgi:signal transduction histidine kinase
MGDFAGVLRVALNIKDAYAFLGENLPFNFKLLDKENRVIYSTQTYTFLENLTAHYFYGQLLNNEGNVVPEKRSHEKHLEMISLVNSTGHRDYKGAGWRLIVEHDVKDAFASVEKLKNWQLLFSCSVIILSLILGTFLAKSISQPIDKLVKAARQIGKGDLYTSVEITAKDETGLLADAFNRMVQDLKKSTTSIDELNSLNDQLKVSQKEMKTSNVKLRSEVAGRKRIQENLRFVNSELENTVEKLGQSNQELQDFVYIASHDLREPLRKISSFGQLLQSSLQDDLSEDDLENFEFMIDGAKRMTEMIEALLIYSRLNTKGMDFGIGDFNEIINQFKHLEIATLIEETNATITVPRQLPNVIADVPMIRQLMQNLIINGIKYRDDGVVPEIVITASDIDDDTVKIQVSDNGIGIKQEMHEAIFKMFKRVHSRKKYEGAGIGLAVCKKIVEKHGGMIGLDSSEGQGSVFWFTIKKAKEAVLV